MEKKQSSNFLNSVPLSSLRIIKDGKLSQEKPERFDEFMVATDDMSSGKGNFISVLIPVSRNVSDNGFATITRTVNQILPCSYTLKDDKGNPMIDSEGNKVKRQNNTRCNILLGDNSNIVVMSVAKAVGIDRNGDIKYKNSNVSMLPSALSKCYNAAVKDFAEQQKMNHFDQLYAKQDVLCEKLSNLSFTNVPVNQIHIVNNDGEDKTNWASQDALTDAFNKEPLGKVKHTKRWEPDGYAWHTTHTGLEIIKDPVVTFPIGINVLRTFGVDPLWFEKTLSPDFVTVDSDGNKFVNLQINKRLLDTVEKSNSDVDNECNIKFGNIDSDGLYNIAFTNLKGNYAELSVLLDTQETESVGIDDDNYDDFHIPDSVRNHDDEQL